MSKTKSIGFWMVYDENKKKKSILKLEKTFFKLKRKKNMTKIFYVEFVHKPPIKYDVLSQKGTIGLKVSYSTVRLK